LKFEIPAGGKPVKFSNLTVLGLFLIISLGLSACTQGQQANIQSQAIIGRGDISVKVNGTGKTYYANDAKLAFDTAGKIEKLLVKEGDRVTKGSILAKLDTGDLELALSQAKVGAAQSQKALKQAQIGVTQQEIALTQAQVSLTQAQSAKTAAEAALTAAQFSFDTIKAVGDIKDKIMAVQTYIDTAEENRRTAVSNGDSQSSSYLNQRLKDLHSQLDRLNKDLQTLLAKPEYAGVATYEVMIYDPIAQIYRLGGQTYDRLLVEDARLKELQVTIAQKGVEEAQQNIDRANQNIKLANQNIELAQKAVEQATLTLEQAQKTQEVAQKQLDHATIFAPFDGVVAAVAIKQGDYVLTPGLSTGTPIYMVDPNTLEVESGIDEADVANVQVNQRAVFTLDALPGKTFTGVVIYIPVTPKVNAQNTGVVVYPVKVRFDSVPSLQVKYGMSASVDIVTYEKKDVLLIPNKAVKKNAQGQNVVELVVDQKTREQPVQLGMTDGTQFEVISGVNKGDVVVKRP
jgi:HlyD family secretion protein